MRGPARLPRRHVQLPCTTALVHLAPYRVRAHRKTDMLKLFCMTDASRWEGLTGYFCRYAQLPCPSCIWHPTLGDCNATGSSLIRFQTCQSLLGHLSASSERPQHIFLNTTGPHRALVCNLWGNA